MFILNLKYNKERILISCLIFFIILSFFITVFSIFSIIFLDSHIKELLSKQSDYFLNDNTKELFFTHKNLIENLLFMSIFLCSIFSLIFIFLIFFVFWFKKSKKREELTDYFNNH